MLLTEFFNSPGGDSSAKSKTKTLITEAKRTKTINHNMVAESNEMADVITAREYANKALKDPVARQNYFDYLANLRAKHGKEYSTSVHKKAIELSSHVAESTDGIDTITVDVPLMIRLLEYAREDAQTDMDLHHVADRLIKLSQEDRTLTMQDYNNICTSKE
jgi:hypothetical protein